MIFILLTVLYTVFIDCKLKDNGEKTQAENFFDFAFCFKRCILKRAMSMTFKKIIDADVHLSARLRVKPDSPIRSLAAFFAHSGDSWFWMAGLGLIWLFAGSEWRFRALVLAASIVVQAVTVLSIKFLIRRQRPEGEWGEVYRRGDPHSFPSGHATRAVMLAVMAIELGPAWFAWVLVLWAPLVCLARVSMGVHFLSDILAGALLGVLMGLLFPPLVGAVISWVAAYLPFLY